MKDSMLMLYCKMQNMLSSDEGQDLVEYALLVALVSLAATAGMGKLASAINGIFSSVATQLNTAV